MAIAPDFEILSAARKDRRILISRDNDYGHLIFVGGEGPGVIRLAITPSTIEATHRVLGKLLDEILESELLACVVVVEADRYRVRRSK
jgi:predicted nuclease of predicted toxin-antitoxin system